MTQARSGTSKPIYDVGIVGGGPAGLSAAIWLARYLHSVALIDSGDPRNWQTRGVNGYLGLQHIRPSELRALGREECRCYDVRLVDAIATNAERTDSDLFRLGLASGESILARRLLLAIGIRDVWPEIPGLAHVFGANAHVCTDCDGYDARGKKVVVIGKGRKAVAMALSLTTWTPNVIICTNGEDSEIAGHPDYCEKLDALNIPVITAPILQVDCEGPSIHSLRLRGGMSLDTEKVFFTIGQYPADDAGTLLSSQLGCARDGEGQIIVDDRYRTTVRDVFAAGDIVPGPQLAIAAAADGAMAALAIHKSLVPGARKLAALAR
jgi:thioredoxin reductase